MIEVIDKELCCGCYSCFNVCPKQAIEMKEDEKGFKYPVVNKEKCIECGLCKEKCPALNARRIENTPKAYACYNKDEKIRLESSSGGIFTLIANYILDKNGVIFGAAFDKEFLVKHICVNNKKELYKLRTSKYVQSDILSTFSETKKILDDDRYVLFTGTPCQINGLLQFLGKEYEKLYTHDIICHGVPSPKVWKKYLEYRKKIDKKNPIKINFRHKEKSWNSYSLLLKYSDDVCKINHNKDLFFQAFLNDLCLRDSCYNCLYKEKNRKSDLTLADFWGIDRILPEMNDEKGTSLVIVNSLKGKELFDNIKKEIVNKEVDLDECIKFNAAMIKSAKKPKNREKFFKNLEKIKFDKLVKKYTTFPIKKLIIRCLRKVKKILVKKNGK